MELVIRSLAHHTTPQVIHFPGIPRPALMQHLPSLVEEAARSESKLGCPDDLTILTWSTYRQEKLLQKTCRLRGIPLLVLNYLEEGQSWETNFKMSWTLTAVAEGLVSTKYVMGMDAADVAFVGSPFRVMDTFRKLDAPNDRPECRLLFNAGHANYPHYADVAEIEVRRALQTSSTFPHLNAGVFLGETEFVADFFRECLECPMDSRWAYCDQARIRKTYTRYSEIALDSQCQIFQIVKSDRHSYPVEIAMCHDDRHLPKQK